MIRGARAAIQLPPKVKKTVVCGLKVENKSPMFNRSLWRDTCCAYLSGEIELNGP